MVNFTTNIKLPTILTLTNKGYTLVEKSNNEDDSLSCVFLKSIINQTDLAINNDGDYP